MNYLIRPLGPWLEPVTENRRGAHLFRSTWDDTLALLEKETDLLGASQVILQIDVTDGELRRDGMLRTHARVGFPGVRVAFDSIHGPLTYATDTYERLYGHGKLTSWQANIRAADWPAISLAIRVGRAGGRCECVGECGHTHDERCDARQAEPHPVTGSTVVLTVAHLDHTPENCDPANLRAMCQRCHLAYDRDHHAATRAATQRQAQEDAGQLLLDLLEVAPC